MGVIWDFIHVFDFVWETPALWGKAGELSHALRRKGKTVGLADCLLATLVRSHDAAILTLDAHFQIISTFTRACHEQGHRSGHRPVTFHGRFTPLKIQGGRGL